ncbi:MAG: glycosyltransferase [Christensenellaceae bacterium]
MKKILFTGGGSAGHVVPNIALIEAVRDEADVCYMGTDGPEKGLIVPSKFPIGKFPARNLSVPFPSAI